MQQTPEFKGWSQAKARVDALSSFLGHFRWVFMPLGLCALVAMGVHAAADALDDRLLWLFDRMDTVADQAFAAFELTQPLVRWVGARELTLAARTLMLLWELAADVVLALPVLGYAEEAMPRPNRRSFLPVESRKWPALVARLRGRPTLLRIARPMATACIALAGGCALARMLQGALYLSLYRGPLSPVAGAVSRGMAIGTLCTVLATFGWRATLRSFQEADEVSEEQKLRGRKAWTVGLAGTVVVLPFAIAALLDASPVLSFFR